MHRYDWFRSSRFYEHYFMTPNGKGDLYWTIQKMQTIGKYCVFRVELGRSDRSTRQFFNTLTEAKQYAETMEAVAA